MRHSLSQPDEIYSIDPQSKEVKEISFENKDILDQITMGKVEERWIKTTDNKKMLTWIVYPPHFDPSKKYPAILYCQGGPQQPVSQFWSYRWNLQLMAANGYIVIAPNRRGLYGFGQEWLEQISGDYGGQNMKDYFSATDEMKKNRSSTATTWAQLAPATEDSRSIGWPDITKNDSKHLSPTQVSITSNNNM